MICYVIRNKVNNHRYIGITRKSSAVRWMGHKKGARAGHDTILYRAIRKYGSESFDVQDYACAKSWEDLCQVEIALIADMRPEYNMSGGGEGILYYSEELRKKLSNRAQNKHTTAEGRENQRAAARENIKRAQEATKILWKTDPEYRAKRKKISKDVWKNFSPEQLEVRHARLAKLNEQKQERARIRAENKTWIRTPELRAELSAKAKARMQTPEGMASVHKAVAARIAANKARIEARCQARFEN